MVAGLRICGQCAHSILASREIRLAVSAGPKSLGGYGKELFTSHPIFVSSVNSVRPDRKAEFDCALGVVRSRLMLGFCLL